MTAHWLPVPDLFARASGPGEYWTRLLDSLAGRCGCFGLPCKMKHVRLSQLTAQLGRYLLRVVALSCVGTTQQLSGHKKVSNAGHCLLDCGVLSRP